MRTWPVTDDCVFCQIIAGKAEASIAYEDGATLAFLDRGQFAPGHTLVVPRRHVADIYALDEATGAVLMAAIARVARAVREAFTPDGITIWQSNGAPWQEVFHLHFHVLPRYIDDGLLAFRPPRTSPSRAELDQQGAAIRKRYAVATEVDETDGERLDIIERLCEPPSPWYIPPVMELELDADVLDLIARAATVGQLGLNDGLSDQERLILRLARSRPHVDHDEGMRLRILEGRDPLGESYSALRERAVRRRTGLFYTSAELVQPMVKWVVSHDLGRVVDAGCGSGRFTMAVARERPSIPVVAVDTDSVATILCRANAAVLEARNVEVRNEDYTTLQLQPISGRTAFLGNPPYVRHHELTRGQKQWIEFASGRLCQKLSKLGGLHAHFFVATALKARSGDVGCFVTSAEWLDANYGEGLRHLLLELLGLESLHLFRKDSIPFADAMTTAAITCFVVGKSDAVIRYRIWPSPAQLRDLRSGRRLSYQKLAATGKWGRGLTNGFPGKQDGLVRLGDIARVHRGAVTGANHFFVMPKTEAVDLGLVPFVRPVVTSAQQILVSGGIVRAQDLEEVAVAPPRDVDLASPEAGLLKSYLEYGERKGVQKGYICSHRKPWWYVGFREPPPIIATYMARQAPAFALNPDGALILNVLHGVYPRRRLTKAQLEELALTLNNERPRFGNHGRLYHGGLQKLEPSEMEDLLIPPLH